MDAWESQLLPDELAHLQAARREAQAKGIAIDDQAVVQKYRLKMFHERNRRPKQEPVTSQEQKAEPSQDEQKTPPLSVIPTEVLDSPIESDAPEPNTFTADGLNENVAAESLPNAALHENTADEQATMNENTMDELTAMNENTVDDDAVLQIETDGDDDDDEMDANEDLEIGELLTEITQEVKQQPLDVSDTGAAGMGTDTTDDSLPESNTDTPTYSQPGKSIDDVLPAEQELPQTYDDPRLAHDASTCGQPGWPACDAQDVYFDDSADAAPPLDADSHADEASMYNADAVQPEGIPNVTQPDMHQTQSGGDVIDEHAYVPADQFVSRKPLEHEREPDLDEGLAEQEQPDADDSMNQRYQIHEHDVTHEHDHLATTTAPGDAYQPGSPDHAQASSDYADVTDTLSGDVVTPVMDVGDEEYPPVDLDPSLDTVTPPYMDSTTPMNEDNQVCSLYMLL